MTAEKDGTMNEIAEALTGLDLGGAIEGVNRALEQGTAPQAIIKDGLGVGLDHVGKKFADGVLPVGPHLRRPHHEGGDGDTGASSRV